MSCKIYVFSRYETKENPLCSVVFDNLTHHLRHSWSLRQANKDFTKVLIKNICLMNTKSDCFHFTVFDLEVKLIEIFKHILPFSGKKYV